MVAALYAREARSGLIPTVIIAAVLAMYTTLITAMYDPDASAALDAMMKTMPGLFDAFGMGNDTTTLIGFLLNYLYGFLYTLFPLVLILLLVHRLIVRPIDRGSMAYLLASPHRRLAIVGTLAAVLLTMLAALLIFLTALEFSTAALLFPDDQPGVELLRVNAGLAALWLCMAGLCLLSACAFRDAAPALWVGGGFVIVEFVMQMVAQAGDRFENIRYATFLTLFDRYGLADGDSSAVWQAVTLAVVGVIAFAAAMVVFTRRDLDV